MTIIDTRTVTIKDMAQNKYRSTYKCKEQMYSTDEQMRRAVTTSNNNNYTLEQNY